MSWKCLALQLLEPLLLLISDLLPNLCSLSYLICVDSILPRKSNLVCFPILCLPSFSLLLLLSCDLIKSILGVPLSYIECLQYVRCSFELLDLDLYVGDLRDYSSDRADRAISFELVMNFSLYAQIEYLCLLIGALDEICAIILSLHHYLPLVVLTRDLRIDVLDQGCV